MPLHFYIYALERKELKGVNLKDMEALRCGTRRSKLEAQKHLERKEAKKGVKMVKKTVSSSNFCNFQEFFRNSPEYFGILQKYVFILSLPCILHM